MCVCVCVCVLCFGNFLWAPFPWLMATSCVLYLALSLHIYIKQRSAASVSLHLCRTCHLSWPASLTIRCLSRPPAHFISFSISYYFSFLIWIWAGQPEPCVSVCMHVPTVFLNISVEAVILRNPHGLCSALCTVLTLILHRSSSLWLYTLQRAAEFDISFNSLSVWLPSVLNLNTFWQRSRGSLFFFLKEKSWHLLL